MLPPMSQRGSTLAEVCFGTLVFSLFVLALLGVLGRSAHLNSRGRELEQVNQLTEGYLEELIALGRSPEGFTRLASRPLTVSFDPDYLYAVDVREPTDGLKKVAVLLYHHEPQGPPLQIDRRRPKGALALCLTTVLEQP
jgi:hypothetical protein